MKTTLIAALALLATGFAVVAPAGNAEGVDCASYQLIDAGGQAYLAIDEIAGEKYLWSIWIYAESNGEAGLQRGGTTLAGDLDICQSSSNPDTGVF